MKIYFSGSHSIGKSTLCRYVSKKYNLPMIHEAARTILYKQELNIDDLRRNIDIVDEYQQDVFNEQVSEESKYSNFVSDRSVIDCLAYSAQHSNIVMNLMNSKDLQDSLKILKKQDSFVFFVRPSKATLKNDGVRESLSWDGIVSIDAQIKLLYEMFGLRYFQINTDNMQERIKLIDAVLSLYKPE